MVDPLPGFRTATRENHSAKGIIKEKLVAKATVTLAPVEKGM
jgi:hypothetical protein